MMLRNIHRTFCLLIFLGVYISVAFGHSGRTDSRGGHNDRKSGGYHYHNSPISRVPSYPSVFSPPARTSARTSSRTIARTSSRSSANQSSLRLNFKPYSENDGWRTWTSKDGNFTTVAKFIKFEKGKANLKKTDETIIRISPLQLSKVDQEYLKFVLKMRKERSN